MHAHSTFTGNSGVSGILSVGYAEVNFTGKNTFSENIGTCLMVNEMFNK